MLTSQAGQTQNDQALQQMFKLSTNAALMMFLMTAIFAPLCEELLFRGSLCVTSSLKILF